jgi:hypothetical protein
MNYLVVYNLDGDDLHETFSAGSYIEAVAMLKTNMERAKLPNYQVLSVWELKKDFTSKPKSDSDSFMILSRYGQERIIRKERHGLYSMSGNAISSRVGVDNDGWTSFFDPEGGPFIWVGEDFMQLGVVTKLSIVEANDKFFSVEFEVESKV